MLPPLSSIKTDNNPSQLAHGLHQTCLTRGSSILLWLEFEAFTTLYNTGARLLSVGRGQSAYSTSSMC